MKLFCRTVDSSTDMDPFIVNSPGHVKPIVKDDGEKEDSGVKEDKEEKEEKTQDRTDDKQVDENVPVKQGREEKEEQRAKVGVLVRQDTVIKEPLDAAMAELAASIDGLEVVTPRGGGEEPVEVRAPACIVPTSDFEEEWRSESEDGDAGEQLVQVVVRMAGVPETSMLLRVGRQGVEKLNTVDSASLSPKWRRTMVPIIIGEMPTNAANSRSSGKKVAEEEEEEGGGEGPEFADSSALGDLVCLSSPHQGPGDSRRSVSPLRLGLQQTRRRGRGVQTEAPPLLTTNEVGTATEHSAAESEESVVTKPEVEVTKEGEVTKANANLDVELKETFVKETQTEDVGGEEREVQTEDMEGEDEGTQTIPIAMSQATMQTEPQPIQVSLEVHLQLNESIQPKVH